MGRPKEFLRYRGFPEILRMYRLLEKLTSEVFYSVRSDQIGLPVLDGARAIPDAVPDAGPLGALYSAYREIPGVSWLAVPVDMPLLEERDIVSLLAHRHPDSGIVAFDDGNGGFEPLPAIYHASLAGAAENMIRTGRRAIVGIGDGIKVTRVMPEYRNHLMNVNTAGDRNQVLEAING
jgi:molybdopterin-guanine dinucleotide biosynthesis protein A